MIKVILVYPVRERDGKIFQDIDAPFDAVPREGEFIQKESGPQYIVEKVKHRAQHTGTPYHPIVFLAYP